MTNPQSDKNESAEACPSPINSSTSSFHSSIYVSKEKYFKKSNYLFK